MKSVLRRLLGNNDNNTLVFPAMAVRTNAATDAIGVRLCAIALAEDELAALKRDALSEVSTHFGLLVRAIGSADEAEGRRESQRRHDFDDTSARWDQRIADLQQQRDRELQTLRESHEAQRLAASLELNGARVGLEDLKLIEERLRQQATSADFAAGTDVDSDESLRENGTTPNFD
jgi:hypothetical protein